MHDGHRSIAPNSGIRISGDPSATTRPLRRASLRTRWHGHRHSHSCSIRRRRPVRVGEPTLQAHPWSSTNVRFRSRRPSSWCRSPTGRTGRRHQPPSNHAAGPLSVACAAGSSLNVPVRVCVFDLRVATPWRGGRPSASRPISSPSNARSVERQVYARLAWLRTSQAMR